MVTRFPVDSHGLGTTGTFMHGKRMLGDQGADNVANNGTGASLNTLSGLTTLTSTAPAFTSADIGRQVVVSGDLPGMYTIIGFTDTSNITFESRAIDGADSGNGSITWSVVSVGTWFRQECLWKTFDAYDLDRKTALGVNTDVRIDGCMELAGDALNSAYVEVATLDQTTPNDSLEDPWRYLRARVVDAGGGTVQVGLHAQGQ